MAGMLPAPFAAILAQADAASAISSSNPTFAYAVWGVIFGGIVTLVVAANGIDSMLERRRRRPSVDVDLSGLQSAIKTLTASVDELKAARADHNGHKERIAALEEQCRKLDAEAATYASTQRSYLAKLTRDFFDRIEGVEKTMAQNFQTVERGVGRVEGALEQIAARLNAK